MGQFFGAFKESAIHHHQFCWSIVIILTGLSVQLLFNSLNKVSYNAIAIRHS